MTSCTNPFQDCWGPCGLCEACMKDKNFIGVGVIKSPPKILSVDRDEYNNLIKFALECQDCMAEEMDWRIIQLSSMVINLFVK